MQCILFFSTYFFLPKHRTHIYPTTQAALQLLTKIRKQKTSPLIIALLVNIGILILLSLLLRTVTPTLSFDDVVYRASTPLYWIQQKSIFRFPATMEHKNVFLYGTGVLYMWPNLFKTGELTANILYWTAFPVLAILIYSIGSFFTCNKVYRLLTVALFVTAPIIFRNATMILIQELWLGVILLSCIFILLTIFQNTQSRNPYLWGYLGFSFGTLPLIKPTGWFYVPLLLLLLRKKYMQRIPLIVVGFLISVIMSGYLLLLFQNSRLYGSPGGTSSFRTIHTASFSLKQLSIHTMRLPFLFLKIPCYTNACFPKIDAIAQKAVTITGADTVLDKEDTEDWIGGFRYDMTDPDKNFGLGGICSFFLILLSLFYIYLFIIKKKALTSPQLLLVGFATIVLIQMYFIRWEDHSGVPYKHIISAFAVMMLFSSRVFNFIDTRIHRYGSVVLSIVSILVTIPLGITTIQSINTWTHNPTIEEIHAMRLQENPYIDVLSHLPLGSNILLVEPFNAPDYQLFHSNAHQWNKIYLYTPSANQNSEDSMQNMQQYISTNDIHYIFIQDQTQLAQIIFNLQTTYQLISMFNFESIPIYVFKTDYQ